MPRFLRLALLTVRDLSLTAGPVAVLGVALLVADVWIVRNVFGWFFVTLFAAALLAVSLRASAWASQLTLLFLSVQLALSVFSRGDYLFKATANTAGGTFPSDVANMSSALFLPYWFWGAVCGAFSVLTLAVGAWLFLRSPAGHSWSETARAPH